MNENQDFAWHPTSHSAIHPSIHPLSVITPCFATALSRNKSPPRNQTAKYGIFQKHTIVGLCNNDDVNAMLFMTVAFVLPICVSPMYLLLYF